jgi:hypothetical protein
VTRGLDVWVDGAGVGLGGTGRSGFEGAGIGMVVVEEAPRSAGDIANPPDFDTVAGGGDGGAVGEKRRRRNGVRGASDMF